VALPGEDKSLALDAEAGMEYLITLYSKQPLDIQTIMRRFVSAQGTAQGTLGERLTTAVGNSPLLSPSYNAKEAAFTAESNDPRAVTALVVAIEHR